MIKAVVDSKYIYVRTYALMYDSFTLVKIVSHYISESSSY